MFAEKRFWTSRINLKIDFSLDTIQSFLNLEFVVEKTYHGGLLKTLHFTSQSYCFCCGIFIENKKFR